MSHLENFESIETIRNTAVLGLACSTSRHADGEVEDVEDHLDERDDDLGVSVHRASACICWHHRGEQIWRNIALALLPGFSFGENRDPDRLLPPTLHPMVDPDVNHDDEDDVDDVPGVVHVDVLEVRRRGEFGLHRAEEGCGGEL